MYPVSTAFQTAVTKRNKRRNVGRIVIDWTSVATDESIAVVPSEEARTSQTRQTADGVLEPTHKWASLDGSWPLDGSYYLPPDTDLLAQLFEMGWWGSTLSLQDGSFPVFPPALYGNHLYGAGTPYSRNSCYPVLKVYFSARPVRALLVVGDKLRDEYPVDFDIRVYDDEGNLEHLEEVRGNQSWYWRKDVAGLGLSSISRMDLVVYKWSTAHRQVKILEFFTSLQETYEGEDIFLISLLEEREVNQGSLPIGNISANEITIRLNNVHGLFDAGNTGSKIYGLVKANRKIRAWLGVVKADGEEEYVPLGTFWSGDWDVPENEIYAETSGRDILELMSKTEYYTSAVKQNPADTEDSFDSQAQWNEGAMVNVKSDAAGKILLDL